MDIAEEQGITYQSAYVIPERRGIPSKKIKDENGKEIVAFSKKNAEKIRQAIAKPISKDRIPLVDVEKELKLNRHQLLKVLKKLHIEPTKRRREPDNRTVPTVHVKSMKKIKKAAKEI